MFRVSPRPCDPPVETGCERVDAVQYMMHKLESTYEWETGWNDRCEDMYWDGEMTAYRRIKHPRNADEWVTFIFTEDRGASQCWMTADSGSSTILTKEGFDCAIAALEEGFDSAQKGE